MDVRDEYTKILKSLKNLVHIVKEHINTILWHI